MLDQAIRLASSGRADEAIAVLTTAIRLSPRCWQAFQYRGELHLQDNRLDAALQDFNEAIRLAGEEPHLYTLRGQTYSLLGDELSAERDNRIADVAGARHGPASGHNENS